MKILVSAVRFRPGASKIQGLGFGSARFIQMIVGDGPVVGFSAFEALRYSTYNAAFVQHPFQHLFRLMRIAFHTIDSGLAETIRETLSALGHECVSLETGHARQREDIRLCVIDWQAENDSQPAPQQLHLLRTQFPSMPILALTARNRIEDALAALAAGASDYLVKPIRRNELALRSEVLLRKAYPDLHAQDHAVYGPYCFELRSGRITRAGETLDLTQKEFELALLFFRNLDRPLSRAFIKDAVWSREHELPSRTMDTHVSRVRSKLGLRPENGFRLVPVYSYGYRLEQLLQPPRQ